MGGLTGFLCLLEMEYSREAKIKLPSHELRESGPDT